MRRRRPVALVFGALMMCALMNVALTPPAPAWPFPLIDAFWLGNSTSSAMVAPVGMDRGPDGSMVIVGSLTKAVDFDPGPGVVVLDPGGGTASGFIAKYASDATLLWAELITGSNTTRNVRVASDGTMLVNGSFQSTIDADPGPGGLAFTTEATGFDIYLLKLSADGTLVWARQFGGPGTDGMGGMVIAGDGTIVTAGSFSTSIDFDPGPGTDVATSSGLFNGFIMQLDADGNHAWGRSLASTSMSSAGSLSFLGTDLVVGGAFSGVVDMDGGPGSTLLSAGPSPNQAGFVARYGAGGALVWARQFGGTGGTVAGARAAPDGRIYVACAIQGTADVDPGPGVTTFVSAGTDGALVALDAGGSLQWATQIGGPGDDGVSVPVFDAASNLYVTGRFGRSVDFDPGPGGAVLTAGSSSHDVFVARYSASGTFAWVRQLGGGSMDSTESASIVSDAAGNTWTSGRVFGRLDLDPGPSTVMTPFAYAGGWLVHLDPAGTIGHSPHAVLPRIVAPGGAPVTIAGRRPAGGAAPVTPGGRGTAPAVP